MYKAYFLKKTKEKPILIIILFSALLLMDFNQTMSSGWVGPYLSAAANFDFSSMDMIINLNDVKYFNTLSIDKQFEYHFPSNNETIKYDHLAIGYVFIVLLSKNIFFFLGDLESIQYLQYFVHIFIVLSIVNLLDQRYKKVLFFVFYGINPVVLYFVNYTFYYFWQVIPTYIFLYYYLSNKKIDNKIFIFTLIFVFIYMIRPTILFVIILFYLIYAYKENWKKAVLSLSLFLSLIYVTKPFSFGPWHTMYVGIGAYDNQYGIEQSDEEGYKLFYEKTGKVMGSQNVVNKDLMTEYYNVLKKEYLQIVSENKFMIVRNMLFNIAQSYALGSKAGNSYNINYISVFLGIIMMVLLLYTKQYLLFFAIGFASGSFTPYYPPISAYMYGSYILIVLGFIGIIEYFRKKLLWKVI